jgi:tetratricopeptide (TPR) repeat protein
MTEVAQVLRKTPKIIFNLDWDELHDQAIRMKEIGSLMPGRVADIEPQAYNRLKIEPMLFDKLAQAFPKICMQTDVQKILEGKQIIEEAQEIAKENQIDTLDSLFQIFFIQAQLQSNANLDENERARLQAQYQSLVSSGREDSPGFNIYESSEFLKNAAKYIADGANSLQIANLDEACQSMDEAEKLLESAASALQKGDSKNLMASSISQLVEGYQALVAAQRAYVVALNASIMSTLQSAHVDTLKRSDQDLFKYGEPVKQACLVMGITPEKTAYTEKLFETQRTANRNLRRLVEIALSPKNLSRIATGMFLVYFVVTFIIITAVMRLSGTIESLEPTTIILILVTSFAAALIAAFGYQALKFLPILKLLAGGGK